VTGTGRHEVLAGWAAAELEAALTVPGDPAAAAFFDVDNTMMQGASIYWLARGLAARKYVTARDIARFAVSQLRFRLLATEHRGDMSQAKQAALAFVKGWSVADLHRLSEEIFDELIADRIWSGTRALAQLHLDAGQRVWLVTAAPIELGRVMADRLRLTGALARSPRSSGASTPGGWSATCCTAPPRPRPSSRWPRRRASTSASARPTATPPTTCRCCRWWATRSRSTRTPGCAARPGYGAGRSATSAPAGRPRRSRYRRPWVPAW